MRTHRGPRVDATILGAASLIALAMGPGVQGAAVVEPGTSSVIAGASATDLVGGWLSADRTVRLDLRADGGYVGSIAGRRREAHGTYRVDGSSLLLRDDSGLRTTVTIHEDALELAGHRLLRA